MKLPLSSHESTGLADSSVAIETLGAVIKDNLSGLSQVRWIRFFRSIQDRDIPVNRNKVSAKSIIAGLDHPAEYIQDGVLENLPLILTRTEKYRILRQLWQKQCPNTRRNIYIGYDVSPEELESRLNDFVSEWLCYPDMNENVSSVLNWISRGNALERKKLLHYYSGFSRRYYVNAQNIKIPKLIKVMKPLMYSQSIEFMRVLQVGNQNITINRKATIRGVHTYLPDTPSINDDSWLLWAGCIVLAVGVWSYI